MSSEASPKPKNRTLNWITRICLNMLARMTTNLARRNIHPQLAMSWRTDEPSSASGHSSEDRGGYRGRRRRRGRRGERMPESKFAKPTGDRLEKHRTRKRQKARSQPNAPSGVNDSSVLGEQNGIPEAKGHDRSERNERSDYRSAARISAHYSCRANRFRNISVWRRAQRSSPQPRQPLAARKFRSNNLAGIARTSLKTSLYLRKLNPHATSHEASTSENARGDESQHEHDDELKSDAHHRAAPEVATIRGCILRMGS